MVKAGRGRGKNQGGKNQGGMKKNQEKKTRHARRLYVSGFPPLADKKDIENFFNLSLIAIGGMTGQDNAVVEVSFNIGKKCAFVLMKNVELASNALALDGAKWEGLNITIRRPRDYNREQAITLGPTEPNNNLNLGAVGLKLASAIGYEGHKLFVGGLPCWLKESDVMKLLESVGPLQALSVVKDSAGNSKGYAFFVYKNLSDTDLACLAWLKMGDKSLTVSRYRPQQESFSETLKRIRQNCPK